MTILVVESIEYNNYSYIAIYHIVYFYPVKVIEPSTSSIVVKTTSLMNNNITDSTYIVNGTKISNTLAVSSSIVDNTISNMIDNIADSVTDSSDHIMINATEAIKHPNNKTSNNIPVILASVFSGLLALCLIVCIVGLILKTRKKPTKAIGFTVAVVNPVFNG